MYGELINKLAGLEVTELTLTDLVTKVQDILKELNLLNYSGFQLSENEELLIKLFHNSFTNYTSKLTYMVITINLSNGEIDEYDEDEWMNELDSRYRSTLSESERFFHDMAYCR